MQISAFVYVVTLIAHNYLNNIFTVMAILLHEYTVHTRYCWTNDSSATTVIFIIVCEKQVDSGRDSATVKRASLSLSPSLSPCVLVPI